MFGAVVTLEFTSLQGAPVTNSLSPDAQDVGEATQNAQNAQDADSTSHVSGCNGPVAKQGNFLLM